MVIFSLRHSLLIYLSLRVLQYIIRAFTPGREFCETPCDFRSAMNTPNVYVKAKRELYVRNPVQQKVQQFKRFIENYRRHIVCFVVVYSITAGVALERCFCECNRLAGACSSSAPSHHAVHVAVSRLRPAGQIHRDLRDVRRGHHRVPGLSGGRLLPVSLHAPHRVSQPHHAVQGDVPQPIHPLRRRHRLPSLHGHDCRRPVRSAGRHTTPEKEQSSHALFLSSSLPVVHGLGHVVNIYIFSISDLSILSCLFPRVFYNNG